MMLMMMMTVVVCAGRAGGGSTSDSVVRGSDESESFARVSIQRSTTAWQRERQVVPRRRRRTRTSSQLQHDGQPQSPGRLQFTRCSLARFVLLAFLATAKYHMQYTRAIHFIITYAAGWLTCTV